MQTLGVAIEFVGNYVSVDFHHRALICPSYAKGTAGLRLCGALIFNRNFCLLNRIFYQTVLTKTNCITINAR